MTSFPIESNGHSSNGHNSNGSKNKIYLPLVDIKEEIPSIKSPSDGNNGNFNRNPFQIDSDIWNLGWTDGRYGQPSKTYLDTIDAEFELKERDELVEIHQDIAKIKARSIFLEEEIDTLKSQFQKYKNQFENIYNNRIICRSEYSIPLAIIYILFAIGLFIADIPLTINLVAAGFGLSPSNSVALSPSNSVAFTIQQIIINYWGVAILALGLIMSGLFVKIFLDKVVLSEPEERSNSFSTKWSTIVVLIVVLVLYLTTFWGLGHYREDQLRITEIANIKRNTETEFQNRIIMLGIKTPSPEKDENERLKANAIVQRIQAYEENKSKFAAYVFIALTILFPIIGGLCFSIGLRKYYKAKLYKELKLELKEVKNDLENSIIEKKESEVILKQKEDLLINKKSSDIERKKFIEWKKSIYLHGYERGSKMVKTLDEGESLYNRCETLVLTKLAEKSRNTIWKENYEKEFID